MLHKNDPIEIPYSRTKLAGLFILVLLFVSLGMWFFLKPQDVVNPFFHNRATVRLVGIGSMVFFGAVGVFILKKLGDRKPGFIIADEGITDRSNASGAGFINWDDITGIKELTVAKQKFISVTVKDPQHYIDLQTSSFKKRLMQVNYKQYGTIANISTNGLQCHHHQLKAVLEDKLKNHQRRVQ